MIARSSIRLINLLCVCPHTRRFTLQPISRVQFFSAVSVGEFCISNMSIKLKYCFIFSAYRKCRKKVLCLEYMTPSRTTGRSPVTKMLWVRQLFTNITPNWMAPWRKLLLRKFLESIISSYFYSVNLPGPDTLRGNWNGARLVFSTDLTRYALCRGLSPERNYYVKNFLKCMRIFILDIWNYHCCGTRIKTSWIQWARAMGRGPRKCPHRSRWWVANGHIFYLHVRYFRKIRGKVWWSLPL